ncbi:hypothetical protein [Rhizohabitans arisaemae]|uniref:hypothetical protein n=1 Tax=Rhizohabitans arisaemae TaxID=2720610 RepID=UPI0024B1E992|nr:hypothetical protein [Rhizohabitans arisaemae]
MTSPWLLTSDADLSPEPIRIYLRAHGWHLFEEQPRTEVWATTVDGEQAEVVVPKHTRLFDYEKLVHRLLEDLEVYEERSIPQILMDLTTAVVDRHQVRLQPTGVPSGVISMSDGTKAYASFRDLFLSAVYRASLAQSGQPLQPVEPSRKPDRIYSFLNAIRLLAPTSGSYVLTAEVPLAGTGPEQLPLDVPDRVTGMLPPRRVSVALQEGTQGAWKAAQEYLLGGSRDLEVFESFANETWGLTANLCEALVEISSKGRVPFSLRVAYATQWEHDHPAPLLEFDAELIDALQAGAEFLRGRFTKSEVLFRGTVAQLDRAPTQGPGGAVLLIRPEAEPRAKRRRAHVDLDEARYNLAINAHQDGRELLVQGDLVYEGNRWRLLRIQTFQLEEPFD